ncbi:MAG: SGNH/GDSL hydrolase family protein [Candidatus Shapirobacteria bacterium]
MSKIHKILILTLFSILICFISYRICYFIAEKFFFDKLFYQKSVTHGYWTTKPGLSYTDFGDRAEDIITLNSNSPNILGTSDDDSYKIVILGDSYLWGQGIKNEDRFAYILESKLNNIRPTKIYSLGIGGDNIFDNYLKYKKSISVFGQADMYIFALLYNDFLLNGDNRYSSDEFINSLIKNCPQNIIYDVDNPSNDKYYQAIKSSLSTDSGNYCAYKNLLLLLPKSNAIYINLSSIQGMFDTNKQFKDIISDDLNVINLQPDTSINSSVSKAESHPSTAINKAYANTLFKEITTNSQWRFMNYD